MKVNRLEIFIEKAKQKHNNKYDYSKVNYINAHTKVCIICPEHGEFWQTPNSHLNGNGCSKCSNNNKITTEEFIKKAKELHGDKYDYSKAKYINSKTKVCIACPIHGEFWVTPDNHLRGRGCPKCKSRKNLLKNIPEPISSNKKERLTTEEFIKRAKEVHGSKYDYSKVEYVNSKTKVCIVCPIHGEFWIRPNNHLMGGNCPKCMNSKRGKSRANTLESFIKTAKEIHGNKYDYSKVNYTNNTIKVCIVCPIHGEFWQKPVNHLQGHGCPCCQESHLEREVQHFLEKENIIYISQYKPNWLINENNYQLSFDFYLPQYNIAIECQGEQHFKPISIFGGEKKFLSQLKNDLQKKEKCLNNNVKLIYYSKYKYFNMITSLTELKKQIK